MYNSPSTHHAIYSAKANVKKGKYYNVYPRNRNHLATWNVTDRTQQVKKRRVLSNAFSERAVRSAEQFVIRHVDRWCELLIQGAGNSWSKPRNIARWSEFLVFDVLTDLCFGKSFGLKEPGENELKDIPNKIAANLALHHAVYPFYPLANHRYSSAYTPADWTRPVYQSMGLAQTSWPQPPIRAHYPGLHQEILQLRREERNRAQ